MKRTAMLITATLLIAGILQAATARIPTGGTTPRVNISAATAAQLMMLPGVGAAYAARILEYRTLHGQFHRVTDLLQVKGIGERRLVAMLPYVALTGPTTAMTKIHSPRS